MESTEQHHKSLFGNQSRKMRAVLSGIGLSVFSLPALSQLDAFEEDDTAETASLIIVNDETPQSRTLHSDTDVDWFRFAVRAGINYAIDVVQVGNGIDPNITLYGFDASTMERAPIDDGFAGEGERFDFQAERDGIYFAKIGLGAARENTDTVGYSLIVFEPIAGFAGPDLQLQHRTSSLQVSRNATFSLALDVSNLGGQLADNTARNVLLTSYLGTGMAVSSEGTMPQGCTISGLEINCSLTDIPDQGQHTVEFLLTSQSLGRRSVISTVRSFDDAQRTKLQADDRFSNNTAETEFTIADRSNFGPGISGNKTSFQTGDALDLSIRIETTAADAALGPVALYFTVQLPDGNTFYITDLDLATLVPIGISTVPTAFFNLTSWEPTYLGDTAILKLPALPELPAGTYKWSIIFARPGTDVRISSSRLSEASFTHSFQP